MKDTRFNDREFQETEFVRDNKSAIAARGRVTAFNAQNGPVAGEKTTAEPAADNRALTTAVTTD